jgi:hypothetical protein
MVAWLIEEVNKNAEEGEGNAVLGSFFEVVREALQAAVDEGRAYYIHLLQHLRRLLLYEHDDFCSKLTK